MKRLFLFLVLLIFPSVPALATDFTATIDSDHVEYGESLTLQLTLSGAKAKGVPDTSALKQSFTILSEGQSSNTTRFNGAVSISVGWQLTLLPKRRGRLTIPPVTIESEVGMLRTAPVTLEVDPGAARTSSQTGTDGSIVSITAKASTETPYQNQSIQYTVRCVVRGNISDASLGDISVSDAIVEQQGKPDVYDQVENGVVVRIAEFHYIITPLQPGKITIPPVVMRGNIEAPDLAAMANPFGGGFSNRMQQVMNFFSVFGGQPFNVESNKTLLDVKSPTAAMDPWLPLTSLKIMEDPDASQPVQIGEPLTRKITLLADGVIGSQLPDLEAQQDHTNFKVYADKPMTGEDIDRKSGTILGWRKESYSLVAQKSGRLVLPAIKVSWWDTVNNRATTAELPERVVNVLPVADAQNLPVASVGWTGQSQGVSAGQSASLQSSRKLTVPANVSSPLLYDLMSILAAAFLFAAFWGLRLRRKINRLSVNNAPVITAAKLGLEKPVSRLASERVLEHVRTAEELKNFLQAYAYERRGMSKNASLEKSFLALPNSWTGQESDDVEIVIKGITAGLYAGKAVDVEDLKKRCRRFLAALRKEANDIQKDGEKLRSLNPS